MQKFIAKHFYLLLTLAAVLGFFTVTAYFQSVQGVDYLYYWYSAGDLANYSKGGIFVLFYTPFYHLGLYPFAAAFIVNSLCWLLLVVAVSPWLPEPGGKRKAIVIASVYAAAALLWSGMVPVVNSDLPHAALLVSGTNLLLYAWLNQKLNAKVVSFSAILTGMALSIRLQSVFPAGLALMIMAVIILRKRKKTTLMLQMLRSLLIFTLICFTVTASISAFLHSFAAYPYAAERNIRTPIYVGLFYSPCGIYSDEALQYVFEDIEKPITQALAERFMQTPKREILIRMACKANLWISFHSFSYEQLQIIYDWPVTPDLPADKAITLQILTYAEGIGGIYLTIAVVSLATNLINRKRNTRLILAGLLVYLLYFLLHLIVEIQARYILAPALIFILFLLAARSWQKKLPVI